MPVETGLAADLFPTRVHLSCCPGALPGEPKKKVEPKP